MSTGMVDSNVGLIRLVRWVSAGCIILVAVAGAVVLVGWRVGSHTLTAIAPRCVAMNPLTAICFIGLAAALALLRQEGAGKRSHLAIALGVAVGGCAFARLGGYLFGWHAFVDRLVFTSVLDIGGGLPNQMAPNTALNFVLLGLAINALAAGRVRLAQSLALVTAVTSFVATLGYAYFVVSLKQIATFIPMALPTAILFLVVGVALFGVRPESGLMGPITGATPGGRVLRRLLPTLIAGPPILGWLRLQGEVVGLYESSFGVAMLVAAMVVVGIAMTWVTARAVNRTEVERERAQESMRQMAHVDHLTGLPNRALFFDRLRQALARAERSRNTVAVMFLDLDGFKQVNDTLGHETGDELLREAAARIRGVVRAVDTAARLGGDEFTVVLEEINAADEVEAVARRLLQQLGKPYTATGSEAKLSASIGISLFPSDGGSPAELLSHADAAMYRAKRAGKNRIRFHETH